MHRPALLILSVILIFRLVWSEKKKNCRHVTTHLPLSDKVFLSSKVIGTIKHCVQIEVSFLLEGLMSSQRVFQHFMIDSGASQSYNKAYALPLSLFILCLEGKGTKEKGRCTVYWTVYEIILIKGQPK